MTIQDDITTQTLKTVKQAQDFAIGTIHAVSERVSPLLPKVESLPFAEKLPKPVEVVEKAFDLSSVLLASAKNVAVEATKAFYPQATTKPANKATTIKAAAKSAADTASATN